MSTAIRNQCGGCVIDFASARAFDAHRVGKHAYTFREGMAQTPPVENGRRCLDSDEMRGAGMELDEHGRWRIASDAVRIASHFKQAA